ncbi:MAG: type II toxin-antitoxin system RelE/ParE family toxin [Flexibacteraceae bacterium]
MEIVFADKKLEKLVSDFNQCKRKLGERRAKLLISRLNALQIAENLEEVRHLPGRFHELKADRKGQWACDLDQPFRLIFKPLENPIPTNEHGQFIWLEIVGVEIIEIADYH